MKKSLAFISLLALAGCSDSPSVTPAEVASVTNPFEVIGESPVEESPSPEIDQTPATPSPVEESSPPVATPEIDQTPATPSPVEESPSPEIDNTEPVWEIEPPIVTVWYTLREEFRDRGIGRPEPYVVVTGEIQYEPTGAESYTTFVNGMEHGSITVTYSIPGTLSGYDIMLNQPEVTVSGDGMESDPAVWYPSQAELITRGDTDLPPLSVTVIYFEMPYYGSGCENGTAPWIELEGEIRWSAPGREDVRLFVDGTEEFYPEQGELVGHCDSEGNVVFPRVTIIADGVESAPATWVLNT